MRTVTVRYLVPVYATVDLDAEPGPDGRYPDDAVGRVFEAVESITRLDDVAATGIATGDVIADSYDDGAVDPATLTAEERATAVRIAESTVWPSWES